jgi:hypothetical protein
MKFRIFLALVIILFIVIGCSSAGSDPTNSTVAYLNALAQKDKTKISALSCIQWEESAYMEIDALLSVGAQLEELTCNVKTIEQDNAEVVCTGNLNLTYDNEVRSIDLSKRTFSLVREDGIWRICSYQ